MNVTYAVGVRGEVIHLLNETGKQENPLFKTITLHRITFEILTDSENAYSLTLQQKLEAERDGDYLRITVPVLNDYEVISLF